MKSKSVIFALVFLAGSLACSAQEVKNLSLAAQGVSKLEINCGAGFLKVEGADGVSTIEVKAEIYARGIAGEDLKSFIEDHVKLSLDKRDGRAVLVSKVEDRSFFRSHEARIDLTVTVPQKMDLNVDDGSGSIEVGKLAGNVYIEDGSGGMRVESIEGDLEIDDGSGEIEVRGVTGSVVIDDGSGSITVTDVGGSVTIDDGSGSIDVDGVGKDLILKETGSGSLNFRNVKGQVIK
jgi:DUF4097 and DUF4098 domain-containing protein YvlB